MDKPKILSGDELVTRGVTKLDAQLPEVGLKDVMPNLGWLEQKQIQSALEGRKHLIEIERIEKRGVLTQAEWREDLNLAEVTQQVGGHWQFIGHNVGKNLFITPEETLFLVETNCLQLKHNGVTVSLQQAYALLLRSKITLTHYKVYSYLSRIGYKVFRYEKPKEIKLEVTNEQQQINKPMNRKIGDENSKDLTKLQSYEDISSESQINDVVNSEKSSNKAENDGKNDTDSQITSEINTNKMECVKNKEINNLENEIEHNSSNVINNDTKVETDNSMEVTEDVSGSSEAIPNKMDTTSMETHDNNTQIDLQRNKIIKKACSKFLSKLENRILRPSDPCALDKYFEIVPNLYQKQRITVKAPDERFIPKNVFLNNLVYELNIDEIKSITHCQHTDTRSYSMSEEVNGDHIRRIRGNASNIPFNNWIPPLQPQMPRFPTFLFRPFFHCRPRHQMNYHPFNLLFQNLQNNFNFQQRISFNQFPRTPIYNQTPDFIPLINSNSNQHNNKRKRMPNKRKEVHLQSIRDLAERVKGLARVGWSSKNIDALKSLIRTFNIRYKMNIRLTDNYEIVNDENIVDTIELDSDDEPVNKKAKVNVRNKYDENFNGLKKMAFKLKQLEESSNATSRCRRAFSKVIKNFNKMYTADVYMDNDYKVFDKSHINLDSSSESDCVIEDKVEPKPKGKLVKNPFNILKRLSKKHDSIIQAPGTSKTNAVENNYKDDKYYRDVLSKVFNKNWLPNENDFGRPEVPTLNINDSLIQENKIEYFFEFIKNHPHDFENWLDVKIAFIRNISQSVMAFENTIISCEQECSVKPIIGSEDCSDMGAVLRKLSIIPADNEVISDVNLTIDFDVYNRDVKNFRKTNRPAPNFRIVCIEESSKILSGGQVAALHSQNKDNAPLVFAVVGINSVSFLQIDPTSLPFYIPNNDMEF